MNAELIGRDLQAIRDDAPLVHNITNHVVMNSTAKAEIKTKGVDSSASSDAAAESAKRLATAHSCVVTVSGETDHITNGREPILLRTGHPLQQEGAQR